MVGMKRCKEADLWGGATPEDAAKIFDAVLNNTATDAQRDAVLVNSAFAIQVICPEKDIASCLNESQESLQSGKALDALRNFVRINS
jgi:anthranilate phosphoribosyltransferase